MKSVLIRNFPRPYFPAFGLNTDQKNSKYGHLSRSTWVLRKYLSFVEKYLIFFPNDVHSVLVFSNVNEEDLNQREFPLIRGHIESAAVLHTKQNKGKGAKA